MILTLAEALLPMAAMELEVVLFLPTPTSFCKFPLRKTDHG